MPPVENLSPFVPGLTRPTNPTPRRPAPPPPMNPTVVPTPAPLVPPIVVGVDGSPNPNYFPDTGRPGDQPFIPAPSAGYSTDSKQGEPVAIQQGWNQMPAAARNIIGGAVTRIARGIGRRAKRRKSRVVRVKRRSTPKTSKRKALVAGSAAAKAWGRKMKRLRKK